MVACEELPLYLGISLVVFMAVVSIVFIVGLLLLIASVTQSWR